MSNRNLKLISSFLTILLSFQFLLFSSGCAKNESTTTGNPLISLSITSSSQPAAVLVKSLLDKILKIALPYSQALPPPSNMLDSQSNTVILDHSWISIGEIEFEATESPDGSEVDGDDVEFQGPFTVDLFSATPANLGSSYLSTSSIRRIKMQLKQVDLLPSGAPSDLQNNSMLISGSVNGNTFTFISDEEVSFEVGGPNALSLANGTDLLLAFKTADLIKKIDLSNVTNGVQISSQNPVTATNACPLIDASSNDLYNCFRKGIEQQADLGKDDGDGELESGEDSVKD